MPRRVIRKLDLAGYPTFDEQLWPINALLVVLCAVVAGMIIGTSEFTTELSWRNGWVRLATLVGSVGVLVAFAHWFRGTIGRRFQLGAAASLLVHAIIGILLYWQHLDLLEHDDEPTRRDALPVLVQYEYSPRTPDERIPQEAHERPIEVQTPDNRPVELTRTVTPEPRIDEPRPEPVPETQPSVEPTRIEMKRNEFAAPRRAERESLLSRSTTQAPAQPSEQLSAPEQRAAQQSQQTLEARTAAIARRETRSAVARASAEAPITVEVNRDALQPSRRAAAVPTEPAPSAAAPTLTRAVARPIEVPRAAETAPANLARVESNETPELRVNTPLARRETASPITRRDAADSAAENQPTTSVAQSTAATAADAAQPTVSVAANAPSAPRAVAQAATSATTAIEQPAAFAANVAAQNAPDSPAAPAQTAAARSTTTAPSRDVAADSSAPSASATTSVAQSSGARPDESSVPSLNAAAQSQQGPARAATAAANVASPANLDSPALAASSNAPTSTSQEPSATSLTRSTTGVLGVGRSQNFDRGLPGAASNATVASAAAQRAASTIDTGPAPAASNATGLRRSRAQAATDSATALAQDVAPADYRGGPVASQLEATSGAAVERAASSAPRGTIAAGQGNLAADTGATQVVSRAGVARSDGGGQPTVAAVASPGQPGRTTSGGAPLASLASDVAAPAPVAPTAAAGGAGAPLAAQVSGTSRSQTASAPTGAPANPSSGAPGGGRTAVAASAATPARGDQTGPTAAAVARGPARSAAAALTADTRADEAQVVSSPQPAGTNEGTPLETSVIGGQRQPAGLPGRTTLAAVGAVAGETAIDAPANARGAVAGPRAISDTGADGPAINDAAAGARLARSTSGVIPASATEAIDAPDLAADAPATATAAQGDQRIGPSTAPSVLSRQSSGGVPVQVASVAGPGGLGVELAPIVGSRRPQAQRESVLIHEADTRFLGREISGARPSPSMIREAAKGFERRGRESGDGQGRQGSKTEEAIERGLDFLARSQQADGSWSFQNFPGATDDDAGSIHADTAATGLALMAFLGGGYDHFEDKHRDTVRRGLMYLLDQQKEGGDLYIVQDAKSHESAWLYSHAIASIALCEALGMTGDEELRGPAQRAIDFIEATQNPQFGGWRYQPRKEADTSVSGWQLMALKSGDLAGLKVKKETYEAVDKWLDLAQTGRNDGSEYVYNPYAPNTSDKRRGRQPTPAMSSVGLLMRMYLGWNRNHPQLRRGADKFLANLPQIGTSASPLRDTYYWYYATQVMFHMRGEHWRQWNARLYPLLITSQIKQGPMTGSWDPGGVVPDRWGPHGGRIYVTTMNLLSLEVYYRHLPIYEETGR